MNKKKKKKKKQNPALDFLVYLGVRLILLTMSFFKIRTNLKTARFLGRCLWRYYHRGRRRALNNLRCSFPEKSERWIWQTGEKSFENLASLAVEVLFTPRLVKKSNWKDYSTYKNVEHAKWLMKEGNGLILVTGHYGNFEVVGYLMSLFGFNLYSVARPLDNKFVNNYLYGVRERVGQKIVDKRGAARQMDSILSKGATLGFIADQDAGRKGIFVDFFGRKASTYKSIGLLALTENIPVCVGYARHLNDDFYFEIGMNRLITPDEWKDKEDPLYWLTQEYTKAIEDFIREDPTQYWWLHRRWKHRPNRKSSRK
jgi:KDO2-lipid IV(A) lauroyltransferase